MKYILLLILSACAPNYTKGYTTEALNKLVISFENDFHVPVYFDVVFVKNFTNSNLSDKAAVCYRYGLFHEFRKVEILETKQNINVLQPIVYHELGHCALNLAHYPILWDIMNPILSFQVENEFDIYKVQMINNYLNHVYTTY